MRASGSVAAAPSDGEGKGIRDRIAQIIQVISSGLYDRDDIIKICVLAVLAGQNVFLFGPPGTGKSMISRRIASIFEKRDKQGSALPETLRQGAIIAQKGGDFHRYFADFGE